jgi:hypothetical protein
LLIQPDGGFNGNEARSRRRIDRLTILAASPWRRINWPRVASWIFAIKEKNGVLRVAKYRS